jgi:hypothetical protein
MKAFLQNMRRHSATNNKKCPISLSLAKLLPLGTPEQRFSAFNHFLHFVLDMEIRFGMDRSRDPNSDPEKNTDGRVAIAATALCAPVYSTPVSADPL